MSREFTVRKGSLVVFERMSSYTMLGRGRVDSARWELGRVLAATRGGIWAKLESLVNGSTYVEVRDRGRSVGQVMVLPAEVDTVKLLADPASLEPFADLDAARAHVRRFL